MTEYKSKEDSRFICSSAVVTIELPVVFVMWRHVQKTQSAELCATFSAIPSDTTNAITIFFAINASADSARMSCSNNIVEYNLPTQIKGKFIFNCTYQQSRRTLKS